MKHISRVLGRQGARELTMHEIEQVTGAFNTLFCTGAQTTAHAPGDGDGCGADHDIAC